MKISNETLAILRDELPRGSAVKIRDRLKAKGITFSQQYIYRCLDPDQKDYSEHIIDEAILLIEEVRQGKREREKRVLNKKSSRK